MALRVTVTLALFAVSCTLLVSHTHSSSDAELLPFEPVQYIRGQLPPTQPSPFSKYIEEATPTQAAEFMTKAKALLKAQLGSSGTTVALVKGEKVLVQRRSKSMKWDTKIHLPYANMASLISVVMPILLEGYKGVTIRDPLGDVLRGKDRDHPLVSGRETLSLLDLLNKLPSGEKKVNLESPSLLKSLLANGELVSHFVNAVLSKSAHEAWMDALMALGSTSITREESGQLVMDMTDLLQSSLTVIHDLKALGAAPRRDQIPLDDGKYLFGWWINCPKATPTKCLIPHAPTDTIFSVSPDLRLYVSPSLELTLIVLSPSSKGSKALTTLADILIADEEIWRQFTLAVESSSEEGTSQREVGGASDSGTDNKPKRSPNEEIKDEGETGQTTKNAQEPEPVREDAEKAEPIGEDPVAKFIHWIWPILVFLFWVSFSHVWVYWMLHVFWFFLTGVSSKAHIPRPQTAAENRR